MWPDNFDYCDFRNLVRDPIVKALETRLCMNFSTRDAAKLIGIPKKKVENALFGAGNINLEDLFKCYKALGIEWTYTMIDKGL